jgi:hypothetical protein
MNSPEESPEIFKDYIQLDTPMTVQQATETLAAFHKTTNEAVLAAFVNLKGAKPDAVVIFTGGKNSGNPCIAMEGQTPDGRYAWNHLINDLTGQPQMRCG